mmetsp:Transcript_4647/g.11932  ORF Transcript_4647/g.11932 Transcript_4647/m.11932 type:complete len:201 (+) Transcript_4647:301-903(+)
MPVVGTCKCGARSSRPFWKPSSGSRGAHPKEVPLSRSSRPCTGDEPSRGLECSPSFRPRLAYMASCSIASSSSSSSPPMGKGSSWSGGLESTSSPWSSLSWFWSGEAARDDWLTRTERPGDQAGRPDPPSCSMMSSKGQGQPLKSSRLSTLPNRTVFVAENMLFWFVDVAVLPASETEADVAPSPPPSVWKPSRTHVRRP